METRVNIELDELIMCLTELRKLSGDFTVTLSVEEGQVATLSAIDRSGSLLKVRIFSSIGIRHSPEIISTQKIVKNA